ncbi:MAG: hypothetical protein V3U93_06400 [Alphaproteobacteria bacterium]
MNAVGRPAEASAFDAEADVRDGTGDLRKASEQLNAGIADRAAMFALDGLLLDQHLVGAAKLLGNVVAALALGLIYRIEDMVGETAVARAADLFGGVLITHLFAPNWARW